LRRRHACCPQDVFGEKAYATLAGIPFPVDVVDAFVNSTRAGAIADQAVEIGAKGVWFQLDVIDSKTVTTRLRKHDYQLYVGGWGADYPDDQDWYDIWMTGSGNVFGGYSNPAYDSLVKKADAEPDAKKRQDLYDQAQKILLDDAGGGMLYQRNYMFLVKPYVQNLTTTPIDAATIGDWYYNKVTIAQH